jgi:tRNA-specific 2-thiouridylase
MNNRVVCAMSGGVDSSVAAALLKDQGYEVIGVFMRSGVHHDGVTHKSCCSVSDALDARQIAGQLGIPFYALNFEEDFNRLIDHFCNEYEKGRTPNPCVLCNQWLKFGKLLSYAHSLEADWIATGHYARISKNGDRYELRKGYDPRKNQAYNLFSLSQTQLSRILFPVGEMEKTQVRAIAREKGLYTQEKPDSQDICFVPNNDYRELLKQRGFSTQPGEMVNTAGEVLGEHQGVWNYTVGQRKGLGVAFGKPKFVIELKVAQNQVVVGEPEELMTSTVLVDPFNYVSLAPLKEGESIDCSAQVRYRMAPEKAKITQLENRRIRIDFKEPVRAVTPGQGAVCYQDDSILGGGWIDS